MQASQMVLFQVDFSFPKRVLVIKSIRVPQAFAAHGCSCCMGFPCRCLLVVKMSFCQLLIESLLHFQMVSSISLEGPVGRL